ncbi:MAG: hypothetical protein KGI60_02730 [Patescibacteria group bacterium]|nr:hypothetical protein [Patescibacteria group bacterium]
MLKVLVILVDLFIVGLYLFMGALIAILESIGPKTPKPWSKKFWWEHPALVFLFWPVYMFWLKDVSLRRYAERKAEFYWGKGLYPCGECKCKTRPPRLKIAAISEVHMIGDRPPHCYYCGNVFSD